MEMLRQAVTGAHRNGRHVGICGEAPATYPGIAAYLAQLGIDSISVNFSKIEYEYYPQKKDGTLDAKVPVFYDLKKNKGG